MILVLQAEEGVDRLRLAGEEDVFFELKEK